MNQGMGGNSDAEMVLNVLNGTSEFLGFKISDFCNGLIYVS